MIIEKMFEEEIVAASKEYSLKNLKDGVNFTTRSGFSFFIKNGKIFKRGPYKADYFVRVSKKEAAYSFRLRKPEKDVFGYSKNMKELEKNLKEIMKYRKVR